MTRKDEHYSNPHQQPPIPLLKVPCIPQTLRDLPQWIGWGTEWREGTEDTPGRWAKVPLNALFAFQRKAKSNDPTTWTTFDRAYQAAKNALTIWTGHCRSAPAGAPPHRPVDGLGFVFAAGGGLFGLDIDNCRNPDSDELTPLAASLIERFASYAEVSPSGTGVKIFGRGSLPWTKGRRVKIDAEQELELYDRGRYFTVTGVLVPGSAKDLTECGDALTAMIAEHFPEKEKRGNTTSTVGRGSAASVGLEVADDDDDHPPAPPPAAGQAVGNGPAVPGVRVRVAGDLTDDEVLGKLQHMKGGKPWALWQGDTGGDHSRADLALCNHLAFFCGPQGHGQVDRLFRQSGLMRDKWDSPRGEGTYGSGTVAMAISSQGKFWSADAGKPPAPAAPAAAPSPASPPPPVDVVMPDTRPTILVTEDEAAVNRKGAHAIAARGGVYVRGPELVQVVQTEATESKHGRRHASSLQVQQLGSSAVRNKLSFSARYVMEESKRAGTSMLTTLKPVNVPAWSPPAVATDASLWDRLPRLDAIINHPVLSQDGMSFIGDGYNPSLRAFIHAGVEIDLPESPTLDDAKAAVDYLFNEVVCDFPFDTPADRSAWLAMLLTPLAWFMYDGSTPFFLTLANKAGAGKGLAVAAATVPLIGRVLSPTAYKRDEDEFEKRMGATARSGRRFVLFDNLVGTVGNAIFDMVLTGRWFTGRILGETSEYEGPIHAMFFGTGNNVEFGGDLRRRTLACRLLSAEERPESRTGFRHPNLVDFLVRNRRQIVSAAATILKAWSVAGRPQSDIEKWGSFSEWSGVVRESIVWTGQVDPFGSRTRMADGMDQDLESHVRMMKAIEKLDPGREGITAARIMELAQGRTSSLGQPPISPDKELFEVIQAFCSRSGKPPRHIDSNSLGWRLRSKSMNIANEQFLVSIGKKDNSALWTVQPKSRFEYFRMKSKVSHQGDEGDSDSYECQSPVNPPPLNIADSNTLENGRGIRGMIPHPSHSASDSHPQCGGGKNANHPPYPPSRCKSADGKKLEGGGCTGDGGGSTSSPSDWLSNFDT